MVRTEREQSGRKRRAKVLLAGGMVLGVGSVATLAAWTDHETAQADFTASVFDTVSRDAGASAFDHHTGDALVLSFPDFGLGPGESAYAGIDIRTTGPDDAPALTTTVEGTVALAASTVTGDPALIEQLQYRVVATSPEVECADASFAAPFAELGSVQPGVTATLAAAGGSIARFCVEVRMKDAAPSSTQGRSGGATWTFTAVSGS